MWKTPPTMDTPTMLRRLQCSATHMAAKLNAAPPALYIRTMGLPKSSADTTTFTRAMARPARQPKPASAKSTTMLPKPSLMPGTGNGSGKSAST